MPRSHSGDEDPLEICVVNERPIARAEVLVIARAVGGLPMLDGVKADDKIIVVLDNDPYRSQVGDLSDLPSTLIDHLRHYFLTYKLIPENPTEISIGDAYSRDHAESVIHAAIDDCENEFEGY